MQSLFSIRQTQPWNKYHCLRHNSSSSTHLHYPTSHRSRGQNSETSCLLPMAFGQDQGREKLPLSTQCTFPRMGKCETGIIGIIKNAEVENARLEISAPCYRGWKMRDKAVMESQTPTCYGTHNTTWSIYFLLLFCCIIPKLWLTARKHVVFHTFPVPDNSSLAFSHSGKSALCR